MNSGGQRKTAISRCRKAYFYHTHGPRIAWPVGQEELMTSSRVHVSWRPKDILDDQNTSSYSSPARDRRNCPSQRRRFCCFQEFIDPFKTLQKARGIGLKRSGPYKSLAARLRGALGGKHCKIAKIFHLLMIGRRQRHLRHGSSMVRSGCAYGRQTVRRGCAPEDRSCFQTLQNCAREEKLDRYPAG